MIGAGAATTAFMATHSFLPLSRRRFFGLKPRAMRRFGTGAAVLSLIATPTLSSAQSGTAEVSTNAGFQTAIDNCPSSGPCSIVLTGDMDITTTLNMNGKSVQVSNGKTDGTRAILDGKGTTRLVQANSGSTVSFDGIEFKNSGVVSMMGTFADGFLCDFV